MAAMKIGRDPKTLSADEATIIKALPPDGPRRQNRCSTRSSNGSA